jgi:hypothetical protein
VARKKSSKQFKPGLDGGLYGTGSYADLDIPKVHEIVYTNAPVGTKLPAVSKRMKKAAKNYTEKLMKRTDELTYDQQATVKHDTGAKKNDQGKLPIDLIPIRPLLDLAAVLQFGAKTYDPNNWRKGFLFSRTYAAAQRHLLAWHSGINNDPDSGQSHLAHALCNIVFLLEFTRTHPELDDRIQQDDSPF